MNMEKAMTEPSAARLFIVLAACVMLFAARRSNGQSTQPADMRENLAIFAKVSTSYVSGHETLAAVNSGFTPRNSGDKTRGAYGNWPRTGTQWVEYEWSHPISTSSIDVFWFDDHNGVRVPKSCRLQYWNGDRFVEVPNAVGLGVARSRYNATTFDEITTTRLRLEMVSNGEASTGILQWRVFDSGKTADFAPLVTAGVDRDVVLPGTTYLNGVAKVLRRDADSLALDWSKDAGPGDVVFANSEAAVTTAQFSVPGDYVLRLGARVRNLSASDTLNVHVIAPAPLVPLQPVYTTEYKINSPLWNARIKALITHWIPHCIDELSDPNQKTGGIDNFVQAGNKLAGRPYKRHVGYPFANAYVHNTVESMCDALMVDPQGDPDIIKAQDEMRATLDKWIPIILSAQEPDGYLQTRFTLGTPDEPDGFSPPHWSPRYRSEHEGYTAGYFIESACADYLMTGGKDLRMYNAAKKLADCWFNNLGPAPKKPWYDGHEEIEQALVRLGRLVNDVEGGEKGDKYIELAKFLLDCRGMGPGGVEYDQSWVPVIHQYQAVGHAVRAVYCYSGMADIAMETGNIDYRSAVQSIWSNLVNTKYYITGGVGSGETSEGFGHDYSLPNNSYCESCSGCGELFFQYKMNLAQRDAKYADLYEDTLYNAILGDMDLSGDNFTYTNPLDSSEERYRWHACPCCVGNFPRTMLMLPTWMYAKDDDGIYVNLFIGSTVNIPKVAGVNLEITQNTDYPWSGNVSLIVNPSAEKNFSVHVRIPRRDVCPLYTPSPDSNGMVLIAVNDSQVTAKMENGYAVITRDWKPGDRIDLKLPMVPQRVKADTRVAADVGRVALRYGPLIYNIESVDQNVDKVLETNSPISPVWSPDLLGGVVTLEGNFKDLSPLIAVPNFARNNRGGRSIVWIRDQ
jgi:uncharacterized protein